MSLSKYCICVTSIIIIRQNLTIGLVGVGFWVGFGYVKNASVILLQYFSFGGFTIF
jgi:hypothetical protein